MAYKLLPNDIILRLADNASIPPDPGNRDYRRYLAWLAEGNTPLPADPLPPSEEPRRDAAREAIRDIARGGPGTLAALAQAILGLNE